MNWFKTIALVIFLPIVAQAQFGLDVNYGIHNYRDWDNSLSEIVTENDKIFNNGLRVGLDYSFRPIKKRMEMTIGASYGTQSSEYGVQDLKLNFKMNDIRIEIKNNFYIYDFEEDCNCPTFNKSGETFKKGFFFQTILGASLQQHSLERVGTDSFEDDNISFIFGGGVGFDIGISSFLTITPYLNYQFGLNNKLIVLQELSSENLDYSTTHRSFNFGIRFGFRRDYKKW